MHVDGLSCQPCAIGRFVWFSGTSESLLRSVLEDISTYSGDSFHIWHMKLTDLRGKLVAGQDDGWGESSKTKTWDPNTHAWTYQFSWGSIRTQYVQTGNTLNIVVTESVRQNSGKIQDGTSICPLALHFPELPSGFVNASYRKI